MNRREIFSSVALAVAGSGLLPDSVGQCKLPGERPASNSLAGLYSVVATGGLPRCDSMLAARRGAAVVAVGGVETDNDIDYTVHSACRIRARSRDAFLRCRVARPKECSRCKTPKNHRSC